MCTCATWVTTAGTVVAGGAGNVTMALVAAKLMVKRLKRYIWMVYLHGLDI